MEKLKQTLSAYNPFLFKRLVKSDLKDDEINKLMKENTGLYLPSDIFELYKTFNGTLLNYENEDGLILRVEPNCFFFGNGYLLDIETAISIFEKHKKKFIKKGDVYFPVFGTGFDVFYTVLLTKEMINSPDKNGVFLFVIGKNPIKVYDTFSLFIETIIQAYDQGIYYLNSNNIFSTKDYDESELKRKLNPNSSLSF